MRGIKFTITDVIAKHTEMKRESADDHSQRPPQKRILAIMLAQETGHLDASVVKNSNPQEFDMAGWVMVAEVFRAAGDLDTADLANEHAKKSNV